MKQPRYEILLGGVVFDTASNDLIAGAIKHNLIGIGWKNVTIREAL